MAGITQGSNFPDYGGGHASGNDPLGNFLRWAWYGKQQGAGLNAVPGQLMQMFNPSSKEGVANILATIFGGGGKFDASPQMGELGMPNQFEPYSVGKAAVGEHLGHDKAPDAFLEALKSGQHQHAHDLLFGGTVHARGAIPKRPAFDAPPTDTAAVIAQKLGISPAKVRAQMQASEKAQANAARERAIAHVLHNHGMANHDPKGQPEFVQHIDHVTKTDQMPAQARVYAGRTVNVGKTGLEHGIFNLIAGGTKMLRQAQLRKILQQQQLHHRN